MERPGRRSKPIKMSIETSGNLAPAFFDFPQIGFRQFAHGVPCGNGRFSTDIRCTNHSQILELGNTIDNFHS